MEQRRNAEELGQGVIARTLMNNLVIDRNANAAMILMSPLMIRGRIAHLKNGRLMRHVQEGLWLQLNRFKIHNKYLSSMSKVQR